MAPTQPPKRLSTALSEVERACELLVAASPEAMDYCRDALARAAEELADFRWEDCADAAPAARATAHGLRAEVTRAAGLLQSLSKFYLGWERILGAMSGGYLAGGEPAPVERHGRLHCRG